MEVFSFLKKFGFFAGSGVIGIPVTIFLYLLVIFTSVVILYLYFLKLHNNGRILDVFHRLNGDEDAFFVPYDLELSNQELSYIIKKAEQWRGAEGERRKVYCRTFHNKTKNWGQKVKFKILASRGAYTQI